MYAFVEKSGQNAVVICRVEDIDKAVESLKADGVKILTAQEVYAL